LILDEPTNHLDLNAVIWLEHFIQSHYGRDRQNACIIVTHDTEFLSGLCTEYYEISNIALRSYRMSFGEYLVARELVNASAAMIKRLKQIDTRNDPIHI